MIAVTGGAGYVGKHVVQVVLFSTCAVYGKLKKTPISEARRGRAPEEES